MTNTEKRDRNSMRAMIGLVVIVLLIIVTTIVMQKMRTAASLEDCYASGRTNCAPIDTGHH